PADTGTKAEENNKIMKRPAAAAKPKTAPKVKAKAKSTASGKNTDKVKKNYAGPCYYKNSNRWGIKLGKKEVFSVGSKHLPASKTKEIADLAMIELNKGESWDKVKQMGEEMKRALWEKHVNAEPEAPADAEDQTAPAVEGEEEEIREEDENVEVPEEPEEVD
ncbi:unnamed protein product, partial [Durusdinium trenchii]